MDSLFQGRYSASYVVWLSPTLAYPVRRLRRKRSPSPATRSTRRTTTTNSVVKTILLELTMPILHVYWFSATWQSPRTKNTLSMHAPALRTPAWAPAWQKGFSTRGGKSLCRSVPSICLYFTKHQKHETTRFLSKLHSLILKCFQTPIEEYAAYLISPWCRLAKMNSS